MLAPHDVLFRLSKPSGARCLRHVFTHSHSSIACRAASKSGAQSQRSDGAGPEQPKRVEPQQQGGAASTSGRLPVGLGRPSSVAYQEGAFVELGEVIAAHGIKGEVKVDLTTDSPKKRFGKIGTTLYLKPPTPKGLVGRGQAEAAEPLVEFTTEGSKVQILPEGREVWILKFKELKDRTQAEQLRHQVIVLPLEEREQLRDPDEFYAQDLIGSHVFMQSDGAYVGKVTDLFSGFGTHDTLQLQLRPTKEDLDAARGRTSMIPFVKELVPVVDKAGKRILVSPPEGLFDLCSTKKIKPMDEAKKAQKLRDAEEREAKERQGRLSSAAGGVAGQVEEDTDSEEVEGEEDGQSKASEPSQRARKRPAGRPVRKLRLKAPAAPL